MGCGIRKWLSAGLYIFSLSVAATQAGAIVVGEPLPAVQIVENGECVVGGHDTSYVPWQSDSLRGKVHVLEHVAARAKIDDIHKPFFEDLAKAGFSQGQLEITKIVNSDDAIWGTSGLVEGEVSKQKLKTPDVRLVVDARGRGQQSWSLARKNAALFIIDKEGLVLFFKEGELRDDEIRELIGLIRREVSASDEQ